jgi:hypothetical protein
MKGKIALIVIVAMLAVPFLSASSDAVSGLIGEGSSDDMSVSYYEVDGTGISAITLTEKPSCERVDLLIFDSDLRPVSETKQIPSTKVFAVESKLLSIGTYTYIVTDGSTGSPIAECDVIVHEQSGTFLVSFDSNGGSGTMMPLMVKNGKAILPSNGFTAPSGQSFKEWSMDGTSYQPGAEITVSKDVTVKAVWESGSSSDMTMIAVIAAAVIAVLAVAVFLVMRRNTK